MSARAYTFAAEYSFKASREAGNLYQVKLANWPSGTLDLSADSPAHAALKVGCMGKENPDLEIPAQATVFKHLPGSQIGLALLEECGVFPTLTPDHYDI